MSIEDDVTSILNPPVDRKKERTLREHLHDARMSLLAARGLASGLRDGGVTVRAIRRLSDATDAVLGHLGPKKRDGA